MGNNTSVPRSKVIIQAKNMALQQVVKKTEEKIEKIQFSMIQNMNPTTITTATKSEFDRAYGATVVAKKQIERGGKILIKDDLIAILALLHTFESGKNCFENIEEFGKFNCEDLSTLIRSIVYNPEVVKRMITETKSQTQDSALIPYREAALIPYRPQTQTQLQKYKF